jgi:transcriptional regulator with XRE-family HTH domain
MIGTRIKTLRGEREWSQQDLAYHAGMSAVSISRIELGKLNPRIGTIEKIAKALGVTPADLVGKTSESLPTRVEVTALEARIERIEKWRAAFLRAAVSSTAERPAQHLGA